MLYKVRLNLLQNPIARWHICQGSINNVSFSADGSLLATVGRDGIFLISHITCMHRVISKLILMSDNVLSGYLRVFDFAKEQLICGCKSYYGALLCCAWR